MCKHTVYACRLRCPYGKVVVLQELATDLSLHRLAALCAQQLPWTARQAWATANSTTSTTAATSDSSATDSNSGVVVVPKSALESDLSGLVGCAQHADVRFVLHGELLPLITTVTDVSVLECSVCCNTPTAKAACMLAATARVVMQLHATPLCRSS
jgi:hypothetical protein